MRNDIVHPDGATGVVFKAGDLVATLTTDKNGEAEVNNLYLGNYYVKEITPSEGYLLDEEEHDVVCDYEGRPCSRGYQEAQHQQSRSSSSHSSSSRYRTMAMTPKQDFLQVQSLQLILKIILYP